MKAMLIIGLVLFLGGIVGHIWAQGWIDDHPGISLANNVLEAFGSSKELSFQARLALFLDQWSAIIVGAGAGVLGVALYSQFKKR